MTLCRRALLACLLAVAWSSAPARADGDFDRDGSYKTINFRTYAPTRELAKEFGERAEVYRRQKALEWLGEEMPPWPERCPLKVTVSRETGGATEFTFDSNRPAILSQNMKIHGELRQLMESVLPHEVTHTVLAHRFKRAVPRWADEGGSVLSENPDEWFSHDIRCREILNAGRGISLRVLFGMMNYPKDMIVVYAQGYSIVEFLVNQDQGGRGKFLEFVELGMRNGNRNWEQAVREVYGYKSVDDLEAAWIDSLRSPPKRVEAASRTKPAAKGGAAVASRGGEVRTSGLGGVPRLDPPVTARGAAPDRDDAPRAKVPAAPATRPSDEPPPIRLLLPPEPPRK